MTKDQPVCEGSCNPFRAPCGAAFCDEGAMFQHARVCRASPSLDREQAGNSEFPSGNPEFPIECPDREQALRRLVEKWRDMADRVRPLECAPFSSQKRDRTTKWMVYNACADALDALLNTGRPKAEENEDHE